MRGRVDDLNILLGTPISTTFYLEKDTIPAFISWLTADPLRRSLIASTWKIIVFKRHLVSYSDYISRRKRLSALGVEVNNSNLKEYDSLFLDEVERTYFMNSGPNHRQLAEFYLLVRRTDGNGWINVISQDRSFERIPMVNTYFIGMTARTGNQDLPAQFDYIGDMAIHRELARAVAGRLDDPNRGDVMINATLALRDHIRLLSGLPEDGRNLMERAFKQDGQYLRVNPLVTQPDPHFQSHQNEQIGFRELYCGVFTGLRNSLVHEGPGSTFAQTRYPDKVTLLKYLSLLSLLFERADSPFP
jgi:uncharacterized protein (TIGR02391 family)